MINETMWPICLENSIWVFRSYYFEQKDQAYRAYLAVHIHDNKTSSDVQKHRPKLREAEALRCKTREELHLKINELFGEK